MSSVIFLNGASSAGKTSIGKAIQDAADAPYLLFGLDHCFRTVPDRWAGGPRGPFRHLGFEYVELPPEDGRSVLGIGYGAVGWRIMTGYHKAVVEIVRAGNPVVIDEMLLSEQVRDHWLAVLAPLAPLLVGVYCGIGELERREPQRRNPPGLARWSHQRVHIGMTYDLSVDTTSKPTLACAEEILSHMKDSTARQ